MNKISLVYYGATGNTEQMAKAIEEGIIEAGGKVTIYKSNQMNKEDILSSDVIVMGSAASGSEVIDENDLLKVKRYTSLVLMVGEVENSLTTGKLN